MDTGLAIESEEQRVEREAKEKAEQDQQAEMEAKAKADQEAQEPLPPPFNPLEEQSFMQYM
jgi:membrane protein involved in colicin uptake